MKRLQSALLELGYDVKPYRSSISGNMVGGVDGDFGNQTKNALLAFQRDAAKTYKDVKATGVLDKATIKALDALTTRATPETPAPVEPATVARPRSASTRTTAAAAASCAKPTPAPAKTTAAAPMATSACPSAKTTTATATPSRAMAAKPIC